MTFGAAAWAPAYLTAGGRSSQRSPLTTLAVQYRQGLYTILGVHRELRLEVLFATCLHWPLEVAVGKAVWRYYHRVVSLVGDQ